MNTRLFRLVLLLIGMICLASNFLWARQVILEYETKISDYGLYFDGDHVPPSQRQTHPNRTDGRYDYAFGRRITPHGDCIAKYGDYVFVTWYRGGKSNRHVMLTRINMVTKSKVTIEFPHRHTGFQNRWHIGESHNTIAVGVSPKDGTVHLLYDMHAYSPNRPADGSLSNDYFRYSVSQKNAASLPDDEFTIDAFFPKRMYLKEGENYQGLTYPDFFVNDNDDLFVKMRVGGHNNGKFHMAKYDGRGWSSWIDYNVLGAGNRPEVDYNWGLYGSYQYLHGKFRIAYSIRRNRTDIYQHNNGVFYSYSNDPDGRDQWFNYKGEAVSSPIIDPYEAFVSEPGDEVRSGGNNSVNMTSSPRWTVTERGDMHFITNNVRGVGERKDVHTYKKASDDNLIIETNVPGGDELRSIGNEIYLIGLESGRPFIRKAEGGTNDWTVLYQATSGKTFRHGNVLVADGKIYYYLMESRSGTAQPLYLQVYDLNLDDPDNQSPVVSITSPENNATFTLGETINLAADASSPEGSIDRLDFRVNDDFHSQARNQPYTASFTPDEPGIYTLDAMAFDNEGLSTLSSSITVSVFEEGQEPDPRLAVASVSASAHQDPNVPENTIDGDLSTRWSANGDGQYIEYELDAPAAISEIRIAWYNGDQRFFRFEIETSMDGKAWTNVYSDLSGSTSSHTNGFQSYYLTKTIGQYVRLTGYGNTANSWNSISAVEIHGADPSPVPPPEAAGPTVNKRGETIISTSALDVFANQYMNGPSHTQHAIVAYNGWQYAAYWNTSRQVSLARRELPSGSWQTLTLSDYTNTSDDAHNVIAVDVCPGDGTIHLAFDHHSSPLRYRQSVTGLATNPESHRWAASNFGSVQDNLTGATINPVTYPRFVRTPNGNLQLVMRVGGPGGGESWLYEYDGATQSWTDLGRIIQGGDVGPYLNGLTYDSDERLHVTWCWRHSPDPMTNHHINYIYSEDHGRTWRNNAGNQVGTTGANPITPGSSGIIIKPIGTNRGLVNQEAQNVDSQGRIHIIVAHLKEEDPDASNWSQAVENSYQHHYWRDSNGTWHETRMPFLRDGRCKIVFDSNDNAYAILRGMRFAAASASSNWSDWRIVHSTDSGRFEKSEPQVDLYRVMDEDKLTVYYQEGFSDSTTTNLYILDYDLGLFISSFLSWRNYYFPDDLDDPLVSGADASPAGDGVENLTRYALNLSPWERVVMKDLVDLSVSEEGYLTFVYRKRTDVDDIEYIPEVSLDLIEWKSGDPHFTEVVVGEGEGYEEIEARRVASQAQKGFIRLKVRQKE